MLARAVRHLVLCERTDELGIIHGADRFVSTVAVYESMTQREDLKPLELALKKLGVSLDRV